AQSATGGGRAGGERGGAPPAEGGAPRRDRPPLPRGAPALAAEDALARFDAGRGEKGPPAQLGSPARGAQAPARPPVRSGARLDRSQRRRLDPRSGRLPMDRRRSRAPPRTPRLSGRDALARQLRP